MEDAVILKRATDFFTGRNRCTGPDIVARVYLTRIQFRRAKMFREADVIRRALVSLMVNVEQADEEILQLGVVKD